MEIAGRRWFCLFGGLAEHTGGSVSETDTIGANEIRYALELIPLTDFV